jgi:anhydro-N-acetylmuramic acid kinase
MKQISFKNNTKFHVIGVMSGTSIDGIDLCYVCFEYGTAWKFEIIDAQTLGYSRQWQNRLRDALTLAPSELEQLNLDYTQYLSEVISGFIKKHPQVPLDAVCSHGHTVFHQPELGRTFQIGNLASLASCLNQTVVCDFRTQDVALGGQGAPLVPIGDALLFSDYDYCINLGGFANLSFERDNKRIAFDVCPVNILLNYYVKPLGMSYDSEGRLASKGMICNPLLVALNALDYYAAPPPKSLGLEWVQRHIIPLVDSYKLEASDSLRTLVEHIAFQISRVLISYDLKNGLPTGGGVFNSFLLERISSLCLQEISAGDPVIIEFKEALIFGFLGVLRLQDLSNCLQSVTGARQDHSSGCIFLP